MESLGGHDAYAYGTFNMHMTHAMKVHIGAAVMPSSSLQLTLPVLCCTIRCAIASKLVVLFRQEGHRTKKVTKNAVALQRELQADTTSKAADRRTLPIRGWYSAGRCVFSELLLEGL